MLSEFSHLGWYKNVERLKAFVKGLSVFLPAKRARPYSAVYEGGAQVSFETAGRPSAAKQKAHYSLAGDGVVYKVFAKKSTGVLFLWDRESRAMALLSPVITCPA
ncbi:hypothetical protein [Pseudomonas alabamensis]|uniref:hypothetical protein n=1 Tax=Pseudomonas alabamensis TaxID=3064349 RepID=UPI0012D8ED0C